MSSTNGHYDLAPASRKRVTPIAVVDETTSATVLPVAELRDRFAAVESTVHGIDVRMESIERLTRSGLTLERLVDLERLVAADAEKRRDEAAAAGRDAAAQAAVLAAALERIETTMSALAARVEALEPKVDDGVRGMTDVAAIATRLQTTVDAQDPSELHADVRLVADRLADLLGGPTLTELMDRIDELVRPAEETPPARRRLRVGA